MCNKKRAEIKELFKSGTIKVFEDESEEGRDVSILGHGAQRSIQMALIRLSVPVGYRCLNCSSGTVLRY